MQARREKATTAMFAGRIFTISMFLGLCSVSTGRAQVTETTPGERSIRIPVAHHEGKDRYGYGTMHVSPSRIWYTEDSRDNEEHSFEAPVDSVVHARPGEQYDLRYLELKLAGWKQKRYYHLASNRVAETASPRIFAVAAALENFDEAFQALSGSLVDGTEPLPGPLLDDHEEVLRYRVVRGEKEGTYSYGWLDIHRDYVSYDVVWPPETRSKSWHVSRSDIDDYRVVDRKGWRSIEIEPRDGGVQAFASCQAVDFGYYVARPHSTEIFSVVRAIDDFDSMLANAVATINGPPPSPPPLCTGTVYIRSEPKGAEVSVDGVLMGSTPARLTVNEGTRRIDVRLSGYETSRRDLSVACGSVVSLPVSLSR